MLTIKKIQPRKANKGVLLDANVFIDAEQDKPLAIQILKAAEDNYFSENPKFAFYTTNQAIQELYRLEPKIESFGIFITPINITNTDAVIDSIRNGASSTDKGLLQALATNKDVDTLVTEDRHLWNPDILNFVRTHYQKPVQIFNQNRFVEKFLQPQEVNHQGFEKIEAYLQAKGKFVGG